MSVPDFSDLEDQIVTLLKAGVAGFNDQVFAATDVKTDAMKLAAQPPSCLVYFSGMGPIPAGEKDAIGSPLKRKKTVTFSTVTVGKSLRSSAGDRPAVGMHPLATLMIAALLGKRLTGTTRPLDIGVYKPLGEDEKRGLVSWEMTWDTMVLVEQTP